MRLFIRLLLRAPGRTRLALTALALVGAALLVLACSLGEPTELRMALDPASMTREEGHAYRLPQAGGALYLEAGRLVLEAEPQLLEDGRPMYPTLGPASRVKNKGQGRYRFESGSLLFSASDNSDPSMNGKRYELLQRRNAVEASVAWPTLALSGLAVFLGCALSSRPRALWGSLAATAKGGAVFVLLFPPLAGLVLAAGYAACVLQGLAAGHALPLAAPYHLFPAFRAVARVESYWPHLLLAWAGAGALCCWLGGAGGGRGQSLLRAAEAALARLLRRFGLVLLIGLFLFSLGSVWGAAATGVARSHDLHGTNLAGLLPLQDGANYFFDTQIQADTGRWAMFPVRRPVACALRSMEAVLGGFHLPAYLAVQTALAAVAVFLAARAVGRWRGSFAAVAFVGLLGIFGRMFLAVTNTETNGLMLACLAIALLVDALRRPSLLAHFLAMCAVAFALVARPGPLLLLPAFLAWSWWRFRVVRKAALKAVGATLVAIALAAALQSALAHLYGSPEFVGTSDIWYVLTKDSDPSRVWEEKTAEMGGDPTLEERARRLHEVSMRRLREHPEVLLRKIAEGAAMAPTALAQTLLDGYGSVHFPRPLLLVLAPLGAFGLAYAACRRRVQGEVSFWLLALSGILSSALLLYQFDGRRTFVVAYPFFWLLLCAGFATPSRIAPRLGPAATAKSRGMNRDKLLASGLMLGLALACLTLPTAAMHLWTRTPSIALPGVAEDGALLVRGGRNMVGLLLTPDGAALRPDVPTMPLATFLANTQDSVLPVLRSFSRPEMPPTPAAWVVGYAPLRSMPEKFNYILAPFEMLAHPKVPFWLVRVERRNDFTGISTAFWTALEVRPVSLDGSIGEALRALPGVVER